MTKICCVCQKVERGMLWCAHYERVPGERVTHGYCPECFAQAMLEISEFVMREKRRSARCRLKQIHPTCSGACA